jgi:glutaminyl-tRNA synthetase
MTTPEKPAHFLQNIIREDLQSGHHSKIVTRFPPEPNGYLHVGHAKSICLNFGLAEEFGGECNLRFDDTNPVKEDQEYVDSIMEDISWLGFKWSGDVKFASNYFDQFYQWAQHLVREGKAYVCELSADQAREYRGTLKEPGKNSPYRDRTVEENLQLLESMKNGDMEEGAAVLRAKIDMAHPNINMRDPILYRIRKQSHHNTGDTWCIYPSYDFAHGQEDAIEGVTHSICTLEFQDHRPLYEWFIENLPVPSQPKQYEFARLHLNYTVTSKRKLKLLVDEGYVDGWDDPRMPTISGMRRRGYTPRAIRNFCDMIGVTRADSLVDVSMLEYALRDDLNENAPRAMCVLRPLKVSITNFDEAGLAEGDNVSSPVHPNKEELGERALPYGAELFIDETDFSEDTSLSRKKFKRLVIGDYVRLRGAHVIRADEVIKDSEGNIVEIKATLVPDTIGENPPEGIRPRGVIHWVSADSIACEVRLYDRLFMDPTPDSGEKNFLDAINPDSLVILDGCRAEAGLAEAQIGQAYQFEREGYFCLDSKHTTDEKPVFNQTIGLKDNWASKV